MSKISFSNSEEKRVLVNQLNSLLGALQIPITLDSPRALVPSLLIAILESLLSIRIPKLDHSQPRDVINEQYTKIFLGILETDVLKVDVGLGNIDPRRLAIGGMEECTYIGEVLCSIGLRLGLIRQEDLVEPDEEDNPPSEGVHSPSTWTMTSQQTFTSSSFYTDSYKESNTSIYSPGPSTPTKPTPRPGPIPGCIHELPTPSTLFLSPDPESVYLSEESTRFPSDAVEFSSREPTVRYTGYISPVDQDLELRIFDLSRSMSSEMSIQADNEKSSSGPTYPVHALQQSQAQSLALYSRRAQLLDEIAHLRHGKPRSFRVASPPG